MTTPNSHPALDRLEELSEKAYPAPWYSVEHGWDKTSIYGELQDAPICTAKLYEDVVTEDNQEEMEAIQAAQVALIVESRNALPVLVECLRMAMGGIDNFSKVNLCDLGYCYSCQVGHPHTKDETIIWESKDAQDLYGKINAKLDTLNKGDL